MTKADFIENLANKLTAENQLKINKGEEAIKNVDDIATAVANAKGTNDKPILIFSDTSKD
ncbi:MAG: hypothetical protein LBF15_05670 [Candidatus Peribacteria bacterium]|jgi:transketolase|nr:hypothetical protein [Candidatus Peribacteria bacterium]